VADAVAQQFPVTYQNGAMEFAAAVRDVKQAGFDNTQNTLARVSEMTGKIQAQVDAIAAQNVTIAAQVADIATLVGQQVAGGSGTASQAPASIGAGGVYAVASVGVPAGFTRAIVSATTNAVLVGSNPGVTLSTVISGSVGYELSVTSGYSAAGAATGGSSHAVTLTGLSGGSVTAGVRIGSVTGVLGSYFTNTMTVTFLR